MVRFGGAHGEHMAEFNSGIFSVWRRGSRGCLWAFIGQDLPRILVDKD